MSSAPRDPKCAIRPFSCAEQAKWFGQTVNGPFSTGGVPHDGHAVGMAKASPRSRPSSSIRSTTWGITSPARWTRTLSPSRTSFRSSSSRLCSDARETVTPPTSTGRSSATGVSTPVRPTDTKIRSIRVTSLRGSNLKAIAHLGWCDVLPSRSLGTSASSFTTTPSIS